MENSFTPGECVLYKQSNCSNSDNGCENKKKMQQKRLEGNKKSFMCIFYAFTSLFNNNNALLTPITSILTWLFEVNGKQSAFNCSLLFLLCSEGMQQVVLKQYDAIGAFDVWVWKILFCFNFLWRGNSHKNLTKQRVLIKQNYWF